MTQKERMVDLIQCYSPTFDDLAEDMADFFIGCGVIVPPCKVGDSVWLVVFSNKEIIDGYVEEISYKWVYQQETVLVSMRMNTKRGWLTYWRDFYGFGDHVFLSKEEAEQALKERETE